MRIYRKAILLAVTLVPAGLWAQVSTTAAPSVLHILQSQTTSQPGFPTFLGMYHVLDGSNSPAGAIALTGTLSLTNSAPRFSEVLWDLVYWSGECPAHDLTLTGATIIWSDIAKNPAQSDSTFPVNLVFPNPLPMTGCVGLYYGGGPLDGGKVTMTADLNLTYVPMSTNPNQVIDVAGEYCFGMSWGCENATPNNDEGFGMPIQMLTGGHLVELMGNISDSTFDGTNNFGPLPTGEAWGSTNDFYLLPGGCGNFGLNLNSSGFPNPQPASTLRSWLPENAIHLDSVPLNYTIPEGENGEATLQKKVQQIFYQPISVNAGDCVVVMYGRTGNGATDNETQVHLVMAP